MTISSNAQHNYDANEDATREDIVYHSSPKEAINYQIEAEVNEDGLLNGLTEHQLDTVFDYSLSNWK